MGVGPVLGDLWQMVVFEKVERCVPAASTGSGLGGVALRGPGNGRVMLYMRRLVELSGTMAVSMAGLRVMLWIVLKMKMGQRKTAAATSVACASVPLRVCWTSCAPCSLSGGLALAFRFLMMRTHRVSGTL